MIEVRHVTKVYDDGTKAVDDISFKMDEGETFGLIGTSGCGKTTTLKMINRLEELTSGSIAIGRTPISEHPAEELRRSIGYVIQHAGLFPHYTVAENIAITPRLLKWEEGRIGKRCNELLHLVGMEPSEFASRKPAALSGGQQQRVGLARALAANPPVILMDEPFGALDPITKERIQKEFKELLKEMQKTIVLVTHDVFEAFDLCDRIGLMDAGKLQQTGTPRELIFQPANEFVSSFFESHRFQLEMMTVTVGDILEELDSAEIIHSPSSKEVRKDDASLKMDDSFFNVFEMTQSADVCRIVDEEGEAMYEVAVGELLRGFQQVRRKLREEMA